MSTQSSKIETLAAFEKSTLAFQINYITSLNRIKRLSAGWKKGAQLFQAIRCRDHNNNRYSSSCEVLLISKVCIQRHKYFKGCFGKAQ